MHLLVRRACNAAAFGLLCLLPSLLAVRDADRVTSLEGDLVGDLADIEVEQGPCRDDPGLNCAAKVDHCSHAQHSASMRVRCPQTCGTCADNVTAGNATQGAAVNLVAAGQNASAEALEQMSQTIQGNATDGVTRDKSVPNSTNATKATNSTEERLKVALAAAGNASKMNISAEDKKLQTAIEAASNNSMPEDEAAKLALSGCKDSPEHMDECPQKEELCDSAKYGVEVKRQCPMTCGVCKPSKDDVLEVKSTCKPKPIVASLDSKLIKASSKSDSDSGPENARLSSESTPWIAGKQVPGQWLEVSLPEEMTVTAVATQGRFNDNQWVSYYKLMYKTKNWDWYHGGKWMKGNWDRNDIKKHTLKPFKAKFVRFYPRKWHGKIAMRVEVYGCKETKQIVPTGDVVKKLTDASKDIVNRHIEKATNNALEAVQAAAEARDQNMHRIMASAVMNATVAAREAIADAAKTAVSEAVQQATAMATARIEHAARHAVPAASEVMDAIVNSTRQAALGKAARDAPSDDGKADEQQTEDDNP